MDPDLKAYGVEQSTTLDFRDQRQKQRCPEEQADIPVARRSLKKISQEDISRRWVVDRSVIHQPAMPQ